MTAEQILAIQKGMIAKCDAEGRDFTPAESAEYARLDAEYVKSQSYLQLANEGGDAAFRRHDGSFLLSSGKRVRTVARSESLRQTNDVQTSGPSAGELLAGYVTDSWHGRLEEKAAVQIGAAGRGGVTLGVGVSTEIIDYARALSVVVQAGASTMEFPPGLSEFRLVRQITDPTAVWRGEFGAITSSDPTFDHYALTPRTLAVLIPVTIEALEDSPNLGAALERAAAGAIAAALDRAVLQGSGHSEEPAGILNATGATEYDFSSSAVTWDKLIAAQKELWDVNAPLKSTGVVMSPANYLVYSQLKDGNGQYQPAPPVFEGVPFLVSNNADDSTIYAGNFPDVVIAFRTNLQMELLAVGTATDAAQSVSRNALTQMLRWLRVYTRVDVGFRRPNHLLRIINVTQ